MSHPELPCTDAVIKEIRSETNHMVHLSLYAGESQLHDAYTNPGQYVKLAVDGLKSSFFAIANAPGQRHFEFLVKRGNPLADAIAAKKAGDAIQISAPMGKGYPLESTVGHGVFVVGVGSGMAPLRALMQTLLGNRRCGPICFIYGARMFESFPYQNEVKAWADMDVEVVQVCSRPAHGTWPGLVGRVQDALRAHHRTVLPGSVAYVCGMKPMVEDVKVLFATLGIPPEKVFQNF